MGNVKELRTISDLMICDVLPQSCESRSRLSVAESMAEYFDAYEHIVSESLSENEASDESGLSDVTTSNSEPEEGQGTWLDNA